MRAKRPSHAIAAIMPRDFRRLRNPSNKAFAGNEATWEAADGTWRLRRIRTLPAALRTLARHRGHRQPRRASA
ncbi:MAG: hypothetical protein AB7U73_01090 [Pirellulales bacterium]